MIHKYFMLFFIYYLPYYYTIAIIMALKVTKLTRFFVFSFVGPTYNVLQMQYLTFNHPN